VMKSNSLAPPTKSILRSPSCVRRWVTARPSIRILNWHCAAMTTSRWRVWRFTPASG